MNRDLINYEKTVKFLGLHFDSSLTWIPHLKQLKIKASRSLNILKVVSGHSWGADQQTLLKLYNTLIKSKISYGSQVFTSAKQTPLKMLDTLHNQALQICTGAYRTSPIESLNIIANDKPLFLHFQYLAITQYFKIKSLPSNSNFQTMNDNDQFAISSRSEPLHVRVNKIIQSASFKEERIYQCRPFKVPPWKIPYLNICKLDIKKSNCNPNTIKALFYDHLHIHNNTEHFYTDGSKSDLGVGCAAVNRTSIYSAKLSKFNSSFTAELISLLLLIMLYMLLRILILTIQ